MAYSVIVWRGYYYIKGEADDPFPPAVGPFKFEWEAKKTAEELNKKAA